MKNLILSLAVVAAFAACSADQSTSSALTETVAPAAEAPADVVAPATAETATPAADTTGTVEAAPESSTTSTTDTESK